ncbi:unnamed protein product [Thlaspi arvense]|uniref:Uncharacterized protein n=1 Tax=Thlaspi arvense TaxID=13288 RepID=A0AAU9S7P9_THLAR|nr:unnamed protein product [Thlaspi arvense]
MGFHHRNCSNSGQDFQLRMESDPKTDYKKDPERKDRERWNLTRKLIIRKSKRGKVERGEMIKFSNRGWDLTI